MGSNLCEEEKSEWTVPYPDVACGGKNAQLGRWLACRHWDGFKEDLL